MRTITGYYRAFAVLMAVSVIAGAGGCLPRSQQPVSTVAAKSAGSPSVPATSSTEGTSSSEALGLIQRFNQPAESADKGFALLGGEHNDYAAWTKATVLGFTDYGQLVSSIASQQAGIAPGALDVFHQLLASRGATAAYDAVADSQWRLQDGSATKRDKQLATLIPASTVMGLLFDRNGRLLDRYVLRHASADSGVLKAIYMRPGTSDATLEFRTGRADDGALRIVGWDNYAQFRSELRGNDVVDGLP